MKELDARGQPHFSRQKRTESSCATIIPMPAKWRHLIESDVEKANKFKYLDALYDIRTVAMPTNATWSQP